MVPVSQISEDQLLYDPVYDLPGFTPFFWRGGGGGGATSRFF